MEHPAHRAEAVESILYPAVDGALREASVADAPPSGHPG